VKTDDRIERLLDDLDGLLDEAAARTRTE